MNEATNVPKKFTRRTFIKGTLGAAAGLVLAGISDNPKPQIPESSIKPERLPADIMTSAELDKARITIYQSPKTQLYLRKGVQEFSLFTDASEGKIDRVVMVLVDNPKLSYSATRNLPAQDVQAMWDILWPTPEEWYKSIIDNLRGFVEKSKDEDIREKARKELEEMIQNPEQAKKKLAEDGTRGLYVSANEVERSSFKEEAKTFLDHHPECKNKVYIFFAVGDQNAPRPGESFISPGVLEENEMHEPYYYLYRYRFDIEHGYSGFALRHEISHHEQLKRAKKRNEFVLTHPEYETDTIAYESIKNAWQQFISTGNSEGYPFVFVNEYGVTITKRGDPKHTNAIVKTEST